MGFRAYAGATAGAGTAASNGTGPVSSPSGGGRLGALGGSLGGWHPSIFYLFALVGAEILLVGWLSKHL